MFSHQLHTFIFFFLTEFEYLRSGLAGHTPVLVVWWKEAKWGCVQPVQRVNWSSSKCSRWAQMDSETRSNSNGCKAVACARWHCFPRGDTGGQWSGLNFDVQFTNQIIAVKWLLPHGVYPRSVFGLRGWSLLSLVFLILISGSF